MGGGSHGRRESRRGGTSAVTMGSDGVINAAPLSRLDDTYSFARLCAACHLYHATAHHPQKVGEYYGGDITSRQHSIKAT